MNRATMRLEVRDRLGEKTENFWFDTHINAALDEGQRRFCHEERWPWLFTSQKNIPVGKGTSEIELIDNVAVSRHFSLVLRPTSNPTQMILPRKVLPHTGVKLQAQGLGGQPKYWFVTGHVNNFYPDGTFDIAQKITLAPAADQAYTAEYTFTREPAPLSDTEEPLMPEPYQGAIIAWATAQMWLKELNGGTKAQEQFSIYNTILDQARADLKDMALDEHLSWGSDPTEEYPNNDRRWPLHFPLGNPS